MLLFNEIIASVIWSWHQLCWFLSIIQHGCSILFVKTVAMEIFSAESLLLMWQRMKQKKYGWHPVWKFEKLAKFFFSLMQCVPFLSDWGVLIYNMVGTAVSSGDVWSSLDLLSSEIQNYLVTMSLYTDLLGSKSAMSEIYQVKGVICVNPVSRNTWLTLKVYFEIWQVLNELFQFQ